MKRAAIPIAIILVVILAIGFLQMKGAAAAAKSPAELTAANSATVERKDLTVTVLETGIVDAAQVVEVKSRVTGRLARLLVDEGDFVKKGQLIAVIDPKETRLRVEQDAAQLRGAESVIARTQIELSQRKISAKAAYMQAQAQLKSLELEMQAQPTFTNAAIRQAETALASAKEERERLIKSVHPNQRTSAQSSIQEAEANYANAKLEFQRQSDLSTKGFVAGRTADNAKLSLDLAKVRLDTAKETMAKLETQLSSEILKQDEQIRQAEAELSRAKANTIQNGMKRQSFMSATAELEKARAALQDPAALAQTLEQSRATATQLRSVLSDSQRQLGETEIRAPIDGVVTKKGLLVGELATGLSTFGSGSTIVKLEDRSSMRVKLDMNEIDVAKLKLGMTSRVEVDALPSQIFTGRVKKIAPSSKDASQTGTQTAASADAVVRYAVEIILDKSVPSLRSGMTAKCSLDVINQPKVLQLPLEFIGAEGKKSYVMIAPSEAKGEAKKQFVTIGAKSASNAEIVSGVTEGAKVVRPKFAGPKRKGAIELGDEE